MALLFMDSFDHYATADLAEKYPSSQVATIVAAAGRRGTSALRCTASNARVDSPGVPTSNTVITGVALKLSSLLSVDPVNILASGTTQLSVRVTATGGVEIYRGAGAALLASSAAGVVGATVLFLELKAVIHPSAGSATVRVNGVVVVTVSGVNTAATGVATWTTVRLQGGGPGSTDFDDFYVCDGSGAAPWNDFLGDCRVDARLPTAAGATTGWTPLAGANWAAVDDAAPDDDTTYTSTSTVNAIDTFVAQDAPVVGATIFGIQHCLNLKKMDAGTCSVAPVVRHSGVDYPGAAISPGTSYAYGLQIAATNPGTSAQWTEAGFNAAEFGYKRTA